jgi:hypothetical protein
VTAATRAALVTVPGAGQQWSAAGQRAPGRLVNRIDAHQGRLQPDLRYIDPVAPPPHDRIYRTKRATF